MLVMGDVARSSMVPWRFSSANRRIVIMGTTNRATTRHVVEDLGEHQVVEGELGPPNCIRWADIEASRKPIRISV